MKIKPMIGEYEIPGIQRIGAIEKRLLVEIPVPGLEGSYHQNIGSAPVAIRIEGTLSGDDARDDFLSMLREKFTAGEPVDFVADITSATEIEKVVISYLKVLEVAGSADTFRYAMTITQYIEPPSTEPGSDLGFGDLGDLDLGIDLEATDLFDIMQIPDVLSSIPDFGNPTEPLMGLMDQVKSATEGLDKVIQGLKGIFG